MKHNTKVTAALILFFFLAQVVGLLVVDNYIDHKKTAEKGNTEIEYKPLPYGFERPEVANKSTSFIYITIAIIIGTAVVLLLIKFNKPFIWKIWFFLTIWITLSIAFAAFMDRILAGVIALILSIFKVTRPNVLLQNLSEIFVYGGLAAIFVPMINVFAASMLLLIISIYDFIAVYKTKHMVKLAKFQSESKIFAGLFIPYQRSKSQKTPIKAIKAPRADFSSKESSVAVLGGGDIGFTLLFAGAVMKGMMLNEAFAPAFLKSLIIPLFASVALAYLLLKGEKNKFYPAMPALSIGCFFGLLVLQFF